MFKKLFLMCLISMGCISAVNASYIPQIDNGKIYIAENDFSSDGDSFHVHIGGNQWLVTNTVHRDETGLYTYEASVKKSKNGKNNNSGYERKWKCPYCFSMWPMDSACQNSDCPSKL